MLRIDAICQVVLLFVPHAVSADVSGVRGSGMIVAPPGSVFPDATRGSDVIALDERQDVRAPAAIQVDVHNGAPDLGWQTARCWRHPGQCLHSKPLHPLRSGCPDARDGGLHL